MNGFVVFEQEDAADRFLGAVDIQDDLRRRFVRSSRKPLFTFHDLSQREYDLVRDVVSRLGGSVTESTQYHPL